MDVISIIKLVDGIGLVYYYMLLHEYRIWAERVLHIHTLQAPTALHHHSGVILQHNVLFSVEVEKSQGVEGLRSAAYSARHVVWDLSH